MGGAEGVPVGKGVGPAGKPARPFKADDFKRTLSRALDGSAPASARPPAPRPDARPPTTVAAHPAGTTDAAFRARIARAETGAARAGEGYGARNAASSALGRYQMVPQSLRDLGWKDAGGGWTALAARHGVASDADFLARPAAQEAAMGAYLRRAEAQLHANGSLGRSGREVAGLDGAPVRLTEAGLVAAAHRRGAGAVARYLAHRDAGPDAPISAPDRRAFAAVERRLRDFAELPYSTAARQARNPPAA